MKDEIFSGVATALITPFKDGKIDYPAFEKLIESQINAGIDALVILGTTGESATISDDEKKECIKFAVSSIRKRVPVIIGTGSNNTVHAGEITKYACENGADAVLIVTPYYNKTSQKGLYLHYKYLSDISSKPIIVYNVPSRTGLNIEPETYKKLSELENIFAIKEANGNIEKLKDTISLTKGNLAIYSGNDDQIAEIMKLGGKGVISVLSNVCPEGAKSIADAALKKDYKKAEELQEKYSKLIKALFCEVNPIPVKAAMNLMGKCNSEIRLPLCEPCDENLLFIKNTLKEYGLI